MTETTPPPSKKSTRNRLPVILITNLCIAVVLLTAVPVIYSGQQRYVPHAKIDTEYVEAAISSGEVDFMHNALRMTETGRAMAHGSHINTMGIMQMATALMAVLFFANTLFLFRLHRRPEPVHIPHA